MKRGLMSIAWLLLLSLSLLPQVSDGATIEDLQQRVDALEEEIATHRSEDWNLFCFRLLPFDDTLTLRLVRPNPPEWNLDAQARLNGLDVYVLPGGGDVRTDLEEKMYLVHLTLHNTSTFFGGHPIVTIRGVFGGPFSGEAPGKPGFPTYLAHGETLANVPCEALEMANAQAATRQGGGHFMGDQEP